MVRNNTGPNIQQEKHTVSLMIALYCRHKHNMTNQLCDFCQDLQSYALTRLTLCRYGENKSTCEKCPTHCYAKEYKQRIRIVMAFSGPRMLIYHPIQAIRHLFKNLRSSK